jgi:uncharacterized membrane protein
MIIIPIALLTCVHILVLYDLRPKCGTLPGTYAIFDGMFVVFWLGVIPHVLMLIFGFITLVNIRRMRQGRRNSQQQRINEKTDAQLILVRKEKFEYQSIVIVFFFHLDDVGSSWFKFIFNFNSNDLLYIFHSRTQIDWL